MKRDANLPELLHRFLYEDTPIPRWTDDEIARGSILRPFDYSSAVMGM
jgi:hypothetical protein